MDSLLEGLELALIRLHCGKTLRASVQGLEKVKCTRVESACWTKLRQDIDEGRLSAERALQTFVDWLRFRNRLQDLMRQKLLLPQLQARVIGTLTLGVLGLSFFLYREPLKASWWMSFLAVGLALGGHFWTRSFIKNFTRRFWYGDWLLLLSQVRAHLHWGQSLAFSLQFASGASGTSDQERDLKTLPKVLEKQLLFFARAVRLGQAAPLAELKKFATKEVELLRGLEQLNWMAELQNSGDPITPYLEALIPASLEAFERKLTREAERLGIKTLIPLFLCYLPAFLVALLGPVFTVLGSL